MKEVSSLTFRNSRAHAVPRTLSSCCTHLCPDSRSRNHCHAREDKAHQLQALLTPPGFLFGGWARAGFVPFCTLLELTAISVSILSHSVSHWELFTVLCLHSSVHCGTAGRCDGTSMGCCSAYYHHLCFQSLCLLVLAKPKYCQPHLSVSITIHCTTLAWISGAMKNQYHAPLHHCHLAGHNTALWQSRGQREKTQTNLLLPW